MGKQKERQTGKTFRSEEPTTIWPPTLTTQPRAFVRVLHQIWGRGLSIIAGAALMGLGFFAFEGALGNLVGLVGAAMLVAALAWTVWRRP